ncbi:MAG: hypothetical protein O7J95_10075, partial [Planctomycetota bacterium]|nr:hypothetical protein [Planctomycetota bacterium]
MSRLVLATAIVAVCCSFTLEARAQAPVSVRTVTAPLSVSTSGLDQESSTEVELSETVNLEGVPVVFLDTIVAEISRSGDGCTTVRGRITLLAGGDEVLSGPFGVIVWCSADRPGILTRRLGIGLDSTAVVDRLRVDIWNVGSGTATSSFSGLFHENVGNDLLQLHFVRGPNILVPQGEGGENRGRLVSGVQPKSLAAGELVSPWSGYVFDQPVPAQQLRYMHHAGFGCRSRGTSGRISTESQLVLDDGSFLSLDDWRSPSNGEAPPVNTTSTCSNSLLLDTETRLALRDRTVVGWRWRIHKSGNEGEVTFTPPEAVFFAFFYDCDLSSNPPELAQDCNANGIADGCEADCIGNGVPDDCDIADGTSTDCDQNSLPDECDILPENIDLAPSAGIRDRPVRARAVLAL